ncbi:hypothetical protein J14TS2_28160 [Bacillus sp. J14TS2]|uniref:glycoside hydrolase family 2 TIM barrel-domain containing protein n=1 Tax=Bacillus sp. J14TS2 TaxID=2807188 RepID=UPI001B18AC74|nr:glycoside hydrolase family 2 TIM barrel-domain containing protein [Bacillus sp. J14TS2]GIN72341.1 hypothetical protein J14TS2_28160 [Bacillus sp. J14TS2]
MDNIGTLQSTFTFQKIDGKMIPFQNGIPYPSFEPQQRQIFSLSGKWQKHRFAADHNWTMTLRDDDWIAKTEKDSQGIPTRGFDDSNWETHTIPLPENKLTGKAEINGAETYENGVWYRKVFSLNDEWKEKEITLKCLGLSYVGDFWINGQYVGYHEGGYTPFSFEVTSFLQTGENLIAIRIDNPPWTSRDDIVPAVNNDFFNYTGIIQDIFLEATNSVQVVRTDIVPKDKMGNVDITVIVENKGNETRTLSSSFSIYETDFTHTNWLTDPSAKSICGQKAKVKGLPGQTIQLSPHEVKVISFEISIPNPKVWSIRAPHLYVFATELYENEQEIDSFYTQFGVRRIATEKAHIHLNDEPIFLAGVARHEDWPGYGRTACWDRIKSDFLKIEKLSVNMVRTAHYPNHIYTFILLDRLGLTAMGEIPLWQFETHHYQIQEERSISYQMWREMIFSNFNRPSIIMWSTQNESKDVSLRKKYNENLVHEVRNTYDDKRLITQSAAADQPGAHDDSMEPLDVAGWTMYFGIFHGSTPYEGTRNFIEKAHQKWPNKPIINTEYGIWSNADNSLLQKQVEIYQHVQQALLEKATVTPEGIINQNGYVAGIDYWTAFDWYVNHNEFYQTMGIYHMDRQTKKPLYDEFIRDHQRLIKQTNGIGKAQADLFEKTLPVQTKHAHPGQTNIQFADGQDLQPFHYLTIKVLDPISADGFTVELTNRDGQTASYQTFNIEINQEFNVFIPLWVLPASVLSNIHSIRILCEEERQLEIIELTSAMGGS